MRFFSTYSFVKKIFIRIVISQFEDAEKSSNRSLLLRNNFVYFLLIFVRDSEKKVEKGIFK